MLGIFWSSKFCVALSQGYNLFSRQSSLPALLCNCKSLLQAVHICTPLPSVCKLCECKQQPPYANRSFSRHSTLGVMSPKLASIFVDRCKIASSLDCPSFLRLQMCLLIFAQEFKNLQGKSSLSSLLLSSSGCDFGLERKKF